MRNFTKPLIHKLIKEGKITQLFSCYYTLPKSIPFSGVTLGRVFIPHASPIEAQWFHHDKHLVLYISYSSFEVTKEFPISNTILSSLSSTAKAVAKRLSIKFRNIRELGNPSFDHENIQRLKKTLIKQKTFIKTKQIVKQTEN